MSTDYTNLKSKLTEKGFTHQFIAEALKLDKTTVTKILNGKDTCTEATRTRVIQYCSDLIEDKPLDLQEDILNNSESYEKLFLAGSLMKAFPAEEREHFIYLYKTIKKYNEAKKAKLNENSEAA